MVQGGARNTSEGTDLTDSAGVIPRAIHQIFSILDANEAEYTVKCSFLELYNEETTDLLAVGDAMDQKLKMLEDSGRVVVQVRSPTLILGVRSCMRSLLVHRLCVCCCKIPLDCVSWGSSFDWVSCKHHHQKGSAKSLQVACLGCMQEPGVML